MKQRATTWRWVRGTVAARRAEIRLSVRVALAGLVTYALAQALHVPLALWAVLTSIVVTQLSVGKSLRMTLDYLTGTLGGAVYGGVVGTLVPHATEIGLLVALALAVAPAAFLAAINPRFGVAPFTAALVLLVPTLSHVSPAELAFYRLLEVALGGGVALAVSLLVFPARAHGLAIEAAAQTLDLLAQAVSELLADPTHRLDPAEAGRIQDRIDQALTRLETVWSDAAQERMTHLAAEADLAPLLRTLVRLRQDLVMIGRAVVVPLPQPILVRLAPPLGRVTGTAADFLRASGAALLARGASPPLDAFAAALAAYTAEIDELRSQGLLRALPDDAVERVFTLGFALEQMQRNFTDLARCVTECDTSPRRRKKA